MTISPMGKRTVGNHHQSFGIPVVPAAARNTVGGATLTFAGRIGMSKFLCFLRGTSLPRASLSLSSLLAVALAMTTQSPLLGREAARLNTFTQPDGTNFFALELKPSVPAAAGPREVVILVSTAAG